MPRIKCIGSFIQQLQSFNSFIQHTRGSKAKKIIHRDLPGGSLYLPYGRYFCSFLSAILGSLTPPRGVVVSSTKNKKVAYIVYRRDKQYEVQPINFLN